MSKKTSKITHINKKPLINKTLNNLVTVYSYMIVIGLVLYMIVSAVTHLRGFIPLIQQMIYNGGGFTPEIQADMLHDIAYAIILIKAYLVLISYADTKHINPKFVLEIGIIAPIIELVFNPSGYKPTTMIFMGVLAVSLALIYLYFYKTLSQVGEDHQQQHG